jgi:hypothetical protein
MRAAAALRAPSEWRALLAPKDLTPAVPLLQPLTLAIPLTFSFTTLTFILALHPNVVHGKVSRFASI